MEMGGLSTLFPSPFEINGHAVANLHLTQILSSHCGFADNIFTVCSIKAHTQPQNYVRVIAIFKNSPAVKAGGDRWESVVWTGCENNLKNVFVLTITHHLPSQSSLCSTAHSKDGF